MLYEFKGLRPYVHEKAFVHPQANVTGNVEIYENVCKKIVLYICFQVQR